ncbi:uncharacterized protein METZ01_LOCUS420708 [marine metagenome]|uniref:Uncharacterized protein n=1 Tax=marine metagenome TaxID=408172 RepID=A0A382XAF4_9ZZZZ
MVDALPRMFTGGVGVAVPVHDASSWVY